MKLSEIDIDELIDALLLEEIGLRKDEFSCDARNERSRISFLSAAEVIGATARAVLKVKNINRNEN